MAITPRQAANWTASTGTSAPAFMPTHAAGDMLILVAACKSSTIASAASSITLATGWNLLVEGADGTTNSGTGTGSVFQAIYWKVAQSSAEDSPQVNWGVTATVGIITVASFEKGSTDKWEIPYAVTGATNNATAISVALASQTTKAGDVGIVIHTTRDDSALTVPSWTQTGATLGTVVEFPAAAIATATGPDMAGDMAYRAVTTGATAAVTLTGTQAAAETGMSAWVRLRLVGQSYAQAQAKISGVGRGHAQAQAQIRNPVEVVAQANALIRTTNADTYVMDTFTRSVSNGAGSAESGGAYTIGTTPADYDVNGSQLVLSNANSTKSLELRSFLSPTAYNLSRIEYTLNAVPSSSSVYLYLSTNRGTPDAGVALEGGTGSRVVISAAGAVTLQFFSSSGSSSSSSSVGTYGAGETWVFETVVYRKPNGTQVQFSRTWLKSGSTPEWQFTRTLSDFVTRGSAAFTYVPVGSISTLTLDNYQVFTYNPQAYAQAQVFISKSAGYAQAAAKITENNRQSIRQYVDRVEESLVTSSDLNILPMDSDSVLLLVIYRDGAYGTETGPVGAGRVWSSPIAVDETPIGVDIYMSTPVTDASNPSVISMDWDTPNYFAWAVYEFTNTHKRFIQSVTQTGFVLTDGLFLEIPSPGLINGDFVHFAAYEIDSGTGADILDWTTLYKNSVSWAGGTIGVSVVDIYADQQSPIHNPSTVETNDPDPNDPAWAGINLYLKQRPMSFAQAQVLIDSSAPKRSAQAQALINGAYGLPFSDTFTRSVSDGLGSPGNGDTWVRVNGTAADTDVNGTRAVFVTGIPNYHQYSLNSTLGTQFTSIGTRLKFTYRSTGFVFGGGAHGILYMGGVQLSFGNTFGEDFTQSARINGGVASSSDAGALTDSTYYTAIADIFWSKNNPTAATIRIYNRFVEGSESTASYTETPVTLTSAFAPDRIQLYITSGTGFSIYVDDISVTNIPQTQYAQAQARIKQTYRGFAQVQARIKLLRRGFAQAAALISGDHSYVKDDFNRSVTDGWGTASDSGGAWTAFENTSNFDINGTKATIVQDGSVQVIRLNRASMALNDSNPGIRVKFKFTVTLAGTSYIWTTVGTGGSLAEDQAATGTGIRVTTGTGAIRLLMATPSTFPTPDLFIIPGSPAANGTNEWQFEGFIGRTSNGQARFTGVIFDTTTPTTRYPWDTDTLITWDTIKGPSGRVELKALTSGSTDTITLDDLEVVNGGITTHAQAQARIKNTYQGYAQAQARIKNTYQGYVQAQAQIKQTYPNNYGVVTVVTDTFTQGGSGTTSLTGHTAEVGGTWTDSSGRWLIDLTNDYAIHNTTTSLVDDLAYLPSVSLSDGTIQIDALNPTQWTGTAFRIIDTANYYYVKTLNDSVNAEGNLVRLMRRTSSSNVQIAEATLSLTDEAPVTIKISVSGSSPTTLKVRVWETGQSEPSTWNIDTTDNTAGNQVASGPVGIIGNRSTTQGQSIIDNLNGDSSGGIVGPTFAQAQARIKNTYFAHSQAQARIKNTYFSHSQAQARIGSGGAFTWVRDTFTRTLSDTLGTPDIGQYFYDESAGSTIDGSKLIIPDNNYVYAGMRVPIDEIQATLEFSISDVSVTNNAYIAHALQDAVGAAFDPVVSILSDNGVSVLVVTSSDDQDSVPVTITSNTTYILKGKVNKNGTAFGKVWEKNTPEPDWMVVVTGALADHKNLVSFQIDSLFNVPDQFIYMDNYSVTEIVDAGFAQAQAYLKATSRGHAQAQALIEVPSNTQYKHSQAQAWIEQTYQSYAQANTWIENTYFAHSQAQAWIERTYNVHSQAQAQIKQIYFAHSQAQARIKNTYRGFAQAQGWIEQTYFGHSQAQARIKQTYFGHAQAQAKIATTRVHAQAQARIKNTYFSHSQAQAKIATTRVHAQAQGWIEVTANRFAQAQAWIENTYRGHAQAQASIENTYNQFAQAQAQIKQTYQSYAQAQTKIATTRVFAQAQTWVEQTYFGHSQAQAWIEQTYTAHAQAQARITNTYQVFAQAQADIKQTYQSYAQANAWVENTYQGYANAQAWIEVTTNNHAQSQAWIEQTYFGFAQAQAKIATTRVFAQAQGQIKTTYYAHAQAQCYMKGAVIVWAQAQADIKQTYQVFAQAQADIKQTYNAHAQAQAWIEQTYQGYAQSQAWIENTYYGFAQAGAWIESTYYGHSQAQAWIENTYVGCGQAQAHIKTTYFAHSQAQAKINAYGVQGYAQAQALIGGVSVACAQAQAKIKAIGVQGYAQAQTNIKTTYRGFAQAQTWIEVTFNRHAQSQAWIENTYNNHAQAQAKIKQTYFSHAQSQALIKNTYRGFAQGQARIKQTYQGYAQANAKITNTYQGYAQAQAKIRATTSQCAQAQTQVKNTYQGYAQAQARVKNIYRGFAQAQTQIILSGLYGYAQAQTLIKATTIVSGQAQTLVKTTYLGHSNAQGAVKVQVNNVAQAAAIIRTVEQAYAQAQAQIVSGYYGYAQAQTRILISGQQVFAQAQAVILKAQGYAQAMAYILQPIYLHSLISGDRVGITLTIGDRALTSTAQDTVFTITAADRSPFTMTAQDRENTLTVGDRNFE